mmetsp:Transcript_3120/g.5693  ORF Transcript_3120/g.5693 Transcript_3120/m.5693 type:complete len:959 (+) Transcript_3120:325-3201(+)
MTNLHLVSEEDEVLVGINDMHHQDVSHQHPLQQHRGLGTSASQISSSFATAQHHQHQYQQRSSPLDINGRSNSLGTLMHSNSTSRGLRRPTGNTNSTTMSESFRTAGPYFSHQQQGAANANANSSNNPFLDRPKINANASNGSNNPYLGHSKVNNGSNNPFSNHPKILTAAQLTAAVSAAAPLHSNFIMQQQQPSMSTAMIHRMVSGDVPHRLSASAVTKSRPPPSEGSIYVASSAYYSSGDENASSSVIAPSPTPLGQLAAPDNAPQTGPSELYRLIASGPILDWDVILQRARSHPHEACIFNPNAGGHVYALHRLLSSGSYSRRPPVAVVEAVMQACPRALTRKQAVIDDDNLTSLIASLDSNIATMEWQAQHGMLPNLPPIMRDQRNNNNEDEDEELPHNDTTIDHDDVRFEYPLAIACECEQDGEVVRLLASYLSTTKPVYRSEVFRSLDYASLPNTVVRILLEEYAGCVLERGMNSEATEGDDDDCPLEQVLFWWDDPDMMGMEEDIANYPNCNMREDLCDLWEKLRMMLYAATMGTMNGYDSSKESFQVLHHVLRIVSDGGIQEVQFPNDFAHAVLLLAKFIQRENGSMFEERDESGSLPLHIAVTGEGLLRPTSGHPSRTENNESNDEQGDEGNDQEDDNGQLHENADREAMDGVVQVNNGLVEGQAQEQNNGPLPPLQEEQQGGPAAAAAYQAEVDEDEDPAQYDEDDDEGSHNDEDLDTSTNLPSNMEIVRLLLTQHPASIRLRDSLTGSLPVHLALQHNPHATEAITHFLELYPRSVTLPDGNGRLPLHTALLKESPVWETVLGLSPLALEARDPVSGLLPFQLAAMSKMVEEKSKDGDNTKKEQVEEGEGEQGQQADLTSLSTTFRLLRMNPNLAYGLGDVKPRPRSLIEQQIMVSYKPRVVKLEEENERLRRKVEELECRLLSMQVSDDGGAPCLKKRKSSISSML